MALDQVHGQNNKIVKVLGGVTSLLSTHDESAPEVARIVSDFEDSLYDQDASSSATKHMMITKNSDKNSKGMLNLLIKQFHVIPLKCCL